MKTLYLLRHFPTPLNEKDISRGWMSVGIDRDAAEPMADKAAKILNPIGITKIESSDLPRAAQSAKLMAQKLDDNPSTVQSSRMRTWNTGEDVEGKSEKETLPIRKKYIKYPDTKPRGGESFGDFTDRWGKKLREALNSSDGHKLLIIHGHQALSGRSILEGNEVTDKDWDEMPEPGTVLRLTEDGTLECLDCEHEEVDA